MLMEDTYASILKAYLYSAVISSGPWLLSILCLSFLGVLSPILLQEHGWSVRNWEVFGTTIVYIFAWSLIVTGLITMLITRFVADQIYLGKDEIIPSTYAAVIAICIVFQGSTGLFFFAAAGTDPMYGISATVLYIAVSCIWLSSIFLSASESYNLISVMFLIGSVISFSAALLFGKFWGLTGFLNGYTLGQVAIFGAFSYVVFSEFGMPTHFHLDFFKYCRKYYELILIGLLYYVAIWADKFIFWFSDDGNHVQGLFYNYVRYDSPLFIAYTTIVPALAIFLLNIETDFYGEYRLFYENVMAKKPFSSIAERRKNMQKVIRRSLFDLFKIQGLISFLAIYFAPELLAGVRVTSDGAVPIFRYAALGAFFHSYVLIFTIILLYYDLRKDTLVITGLFAFLNIIFTLISKFMGEAYYGTGYLATCLIVFIVGFIYLQKRLGQLEYLTFTGQPILGRKHDSPLLLARPNGGYGRYVDLDKARASVN